MNLYRAIRKSIRKKHYSVEKQAKDLISSPKMKTNIERFSRIIIREMWIKVAMRYNNTSTNMAKFNSDETVDENVKQQELLYMAGDTWGKVCPIY